MSLNSTPTLSPVRCRSLHRSQAKLSGSTVIALVTMATLLGGCLNRELKPILPCTVSGVAEDVKINPIDKVDLLMMIDNSPSMIDEQDKLRRELPRLVQVLASGDLQAGQPAGTPGLGEADFPVLSSLRVGVITPDLGTNPIMACPEPVGDDAELVSTTSDASAAGCSNWPSSFIELNPRATSTQEQLDFGEQAGCVATTGTTGCGFEQQLEALLKSVVPANSGISPPFANTDGKGDINNFVREDSLLVVLFVTDEEDCSTGNAEVFNDSSNSLRVSLPAEFDGKSTINYRCPAFADQLFKVQRYIDGLLNLRADPGNLVFAAITGVPQDLAGDNFGAMLDSPDMQYKPILDPVTNNQAVRLAPACVSADGTQDADPARRIVEVARGLAEGNEVGEAGVTVQSICAESFAPALNEVLEIVGNKLNVCLPRELNPNAAGFVTCDIIETLPEGQSCDTSRGREFVDTVQGRERCRIQQLQVPGDRGSADSLSCNGGDCGWFYDTVSAAVDACPDARKQTLSFSDGADPIPGSTFRLECLQPVQNSIPGVEDVGGPCADDPDGRCPAEEAACARNLICDPDLRVWRQACANDSDCSFGAICDDVCPCSGDNAACLDATCDGNKRRQPVCVNPTCAQ